MQNYRTITTSLHRCIQCPIQTCFGTVWAPAQKMGSEKVFHTQTLRKNYIKWPTNTSVPKTFLRDTSMLSQRHQLLNIFWPWALIMWWLWVSLNYLYTNVKKITCYKTSWCWALIRDWLWREIKNVGDCLKRGG